MSVPSLLKCQSHGAGMAELINFSSRDDLLEFRDAAEAKVDELLLRMLSAVGRLQKTIMPADHDELVALQLERARSVSRLELMQEMTDVVGTNRSSLLSMMGRVPGSTLIVVGYEDRSTSVELVARREQAKIVCSDIELVETDESGLLKPFWGERKPLILPPQT
jgi:hypothetical protein